MIRNFAVQLPDPRICSSNDTGEYAAVYTAAAACLSAATSVDLQPHQTVIDQALEQLSGQASSGALVTLMAEAPSVAIRRELYRRLHRLAIAPGMGSQLFALPLIIVTGAASRSDVSGTLPNISAVREILIAHGALAGNQQFGLSNALAANEAINLSALPALQAAASMMTEALRVKPARMVAEADEHVYLRFIVGAAVSANPEALTQSTTVEPWGMALTHEITKQLASPTVSLLALPRPIAHPQIARQTGLTAHREVAAQLFCSNAIRKFRASVGEPSAVLSAHRLPDGSGELRLSLSSPFEVRDAEGFAAPLYDFDRVSDVQKMLTDLLAECRVSDVRILAEVYPDQNESTKQTLFFKPEMLGWDETWMSTQQRH